MKAKVGKPSNDMGVFASASISKAPSQLSGQGKLRIAGSLLLAATCFGCATSNYDFDALSDESNDYRIARLSEDWTLKSEGANEEDKGLYEVRVLPLTHTSLKVFTESDEDGIPEGFVEADINACLPLFGFLDVSIKRFDSDFKMYEQQEYNSYFWGLFQLHRERIETEVGLREEKRRRFLWFFGWNSSPKYVN